MDVSRDAIDDSGGILHCAFVWISASAGMTGGLSRPTLPAREIIEGRKTLHNECVFGTGSGIITRYNDVHCAVPPCKIVVK
ncbi:MAG: hypothetical protein CEE38_12950 [Planctomycetes bacterium B3_Pla]|nr:MAG: hypothetical protein CEE38_12950 [Planctomycetes bacterium B3_Pla]